MPTKYVRYVALRVLEKSFRFHEFSFFRFSFQLKYAFKPGTTAVLNTDIYNFDIEETVTPIASGSLETPMDTA